jgi:hypothetical protein
LWWTVWIAFPARLSTSLRFFPQGKIGYTFALCAALAATAVLGLRLLRRPGQPPGAPLTGRDGAVLAAGALLIVLFWKEVFLRGWMPSNALFLYFFHPQTALTGEYLQNGVLPLWNPWGNCGAPFMADPLSGAFYPLNLALHLWGYPAGFRFWLFLHLFLLYLFTYLWARDRGADALSSGVAGSLLAFNAYVTAHMGYMSHFASLVWTPFLLHAWDRRAWRWVSAGAALQLLAGNHQYFYMTVLAMAVFSAAGRERPALWLKTGAALGAGLILAAFQVLPSWELIRQSVRSGALDFETAVRYSQPPLQLLKFLFAPLWIHWRPAVAGDPAITLFYAGPAALFLAAAAFRNKPGKAAAPAALLIVGIALSLGSHTPLYRALYHVLPGLSLFRFPAQWMWLAALGLALLASRGASGLAPRWRLAAAAVVAADLFAFNLKPVYLYTQPAFLSHKGPFVETLQKSPGRLMETKAVEEWRYGELPDDTVGTNTFSSWLSVKEFSLISQGLPFHVKEAKSITNHTLRSVDDLHRRSYAGGSEGEAALKELGVAHLLDVSDPSQLDASFSWRPVSGLPRLRTSQGAAAPAEAAQDTPNGMLLKLAAPAAADGELVVGDAYYPGWKAFAGTESRALARSGVFRKIFFKKGDETLLLRYEAPYFFAGLGASLLAGWIALFAGRRGGKKAARPGRFALGLCLAASGLIYIGMSLYNFGPGQPYANAFSTEPWMFVSMKNFHLFAAAQALAGLLQCAAAGLCFFPPGKEGQKTPAAAGK